MKTPLKIIAPALAALALATAGSASAGDRTAAIQHSDLDLTTVSGQETLQKRIRGAVSKMCGTSGTVTLREQMDSKKCAAIASAQAEKAVRVAIARQNEGERVATAISPVVAGN